MVHRHFAAAGAAGNEKCAGLVKPTPCVNVYVYTYDSYGDGNIADTFYCPSEDPNCCDKGTSCEKGNVDGKYFFSVGFAAPGEYALQLPLCLEEGKHTISMEADDYAVDDSNRVCVTLDPTNPCDLLEIDLQNSVRTTRNFM